MFHFKLDRAFGCCVWLFTGPTNTDDDFERYCASFARADGLAQSLPMRPVGILVVDPENPMPSAKWRKKIAEAAATVRSRPAVAFCSPSPFVRGIVLAVNWFHPLPMDFTVVRTFDDGLRWIEEKRGARVPRLAELLAECRAAARSTKS